MKYHKQEFRHNPDAGIYGDCVRTAIACMLDLEREDVPHWNHDLPPGDEFTRRVEEWLRPRGLMLCMMNFECPSVDVALSLTAGCMSGKPVLFSGTSRNGTPHVVIAMSGNILHDTAQDDSGVVGPLPDGSYQFEFLCRLTTP